MNQGKVLGARKYSVCNVVINPNQSQKPGLGFTLASVRLPCQEI